MAASVNDGTLANHAKFSNCSRADMAFMINERAGASAFNPCFAAPVEIDECASNPCLNGGACTAFNSGYYCVCVAGFAGTDCSLAATCDSSPCLNAGSCIEFGNSVGYECYCPEGTVGDLCETVINECDSSPCQNGATCMDGIFSLTCTCALGFFGTLCDIDLDECAGSFGVLLDGVPVTTYGDLLQLSGSAGTVAISGTTATVTATSSSSFTYGTAVFTQLASVSGTWQWEVTIDNIGAVAGQFDLLICIADSSILTTASATTYIVGSVVPGHCITNAGHVYHRSSNQAVVYAGALTTGDRIGVSLNLDSSTLEFLINDVGQGTVAAESPTSDGYVLAISMGLLDQQVTITSLNYCLNGATCVDAANSVTCLCATGYTGDRCDQDIDECATGTPCQNGGVCTNSPAGSFTCACIAPFEGSLCADANVGMSRCRAALFCSSGALTTTTEDHQNGDAPVVVGGASSARATITTIGTDVSVVDLDVFGINPSSSFSDVSMQLSVDGTAVMVIHEKRTATLSSCQFQTPAGFDLVSGDVLGTCLVIRLTQVIT